MGCPSCENWLSSWISTATSIVGPLETISSWFSFKPVSIAKLTNWSRLLYKIWTSLCGGAAVDTRGAEIQQSIEIQKASKLPSQGERGRSSTLEEKQPVEEDAADHEADDVEKSGKSMLNYAFGVGAVRDAAPKAKAPDYDPYADFDDGFDRYDDSD